MDDPCLIISFGTIGIGIGGCDTISGRPYVWLGRLPRLDGFRRLMRQSKEHCRPLLPSSGILGVGVAVNIAASRGLVLKAQLVWHFHSLTLII